MNNNHDNSKSNNNGKPCVEFIYEKPKLARKPWGIYCIVFKNEVVYIGRTSVSFENRFSAHRREILKGSNSMLLYRGLCVEGVDIDEVKFKPLIDIEGLNFRGRDIDERDLAVMEFALIRALKPKFNVEGLSGEAPFNLDF